MSSPKKNLWSFSSLVAAPEGAVTPSPTVKKCQTNGSLSVAYGNTNSTCTYVDP